MAFILRTVVEVREYQRGLLYENGKFIRLVEPGRYAWWGWQARHLTVVDIREVSANVEGQEILTSDKIGVRVSLIAQYRIKDPVLAKHTVTDYASQLYQDLQMTLRENIVGRTLEEVLKERDALGTGLLQAVAPRAEKYGVALGRVGVKDIMLPGNLRAAFAQEMEADLKGRAALVAARHETAAARSRANTAKLLQENPDILRLQELETLAALAAKSGNVLILPGGMENLLSRKPEKGPTA